MPLQAITAFGRGANESCPFDPDSLTWLAMALSKQDQAFYEEKLNYKSIGYLFGATTLIGAIMCPLLLFIQDWSVGQTSKWSANVVYDLAVMGFLLGTVVAVVMYLGFKFLLAMGWLPSRP